MVFSENIESLKKMPKLILLLCMVLTISPGFLARLDIYYFDDMVWFLLLFPCFIFSYYIAERLFSTRLEHSE
jgi:hypothetical protein